MGNKKKNNKSNMFPFSNEIKELKAKFKDMVDSMSDDEFIDLISFLSFCMDDDEDFEFDDDEFEELEDDLEDFNKNNLIFGDFNKIDDDDIPF